MLSQHISCDPAIPLLGNCPMERGVLVHQKKVLFIIDQGNCPHAINSTIHTMENTSNKNEHYCLGKTMDKIHRLYVEKLNIIVYLLYASFISSRKGKLIHGDGSWSSGLALSRGCAWQEARSLEGSRTARDVPLWIWMPLT